MLNIQVRKRQVASEPVKLRKKLEEDSGAGG
jgi:hypothetical protein